MVALPPLPLFGILSNTRWAVLRMASTVPRSCGGGSARSWRASARRTSSLHDGSYSPCTCSRRRAGRRPRPPWGKKTRGCRRPRPLRGGGAPGTAPTTTPCAASTPWPRAPFYTGDALRVPFPASPPPQAVGAPGFIVSAGREPIQEHPRVRKGSWLPRRHSLAAGEPPMAGVSARPRAAA